MLLWLWCRLPAAALIRPLAWELPYATGAALKEKKKNLYPVDGYLDSILPVHMHGAHLET